MANEFDLDITATIWSKYGYRWEVGPDADGLSIEIRYYNDKNDKYPASSVQFETGAVDKIIEAINMVKANLLACE